LRARLSPAPQSGDSAGASAADLARRKAGRPPVPLVVAAAPSRPRGGATVSVPLGIRQLPTAAQTPLEESTEAMRDDLPVRMAGRLGSAHEDDRHAAASLDMHLDMSRGPEVNTAADMLCRGDDAVVERQARVEAERQARKIVAPPRRMPAVPAEELPIGAKVAISALATRVSPSLRGLIGEVVSIGRQVEVHFAALEADPRGPLRKINRDQVMLANSEPEPEFNSYFHFS